MEPLSPDIVVRQSFSLPMAGNRDGKTEFAAMANIIDAAWPGVSVEPEFMFGDDDKLLVMARIRGADGALDQAMIEFSRVRDGRAVDCQPFYFDPDAAAAAFHKGA
jgi:hypothetical protein